MYSRGPEENQSQEYWQGGHYDWSNEHPRLLSWRSPQVQWPNRPWFPFVHHLWSGKDLAEAYSEYQKLNLQLASEHDRCRSLGWRFSREAENEFRWKVLIHNIQPLQKYVLAKAYWQVEKDIRFRTLDVWVYRFTDYGVAPWLVFSEFVGEFMIPSII